MNAASVGMLEEILATQSFRHKHVQFDRARLDKTRSLLEATTKTEDVDRALDATLKEAGVDNALRQVKGKAKLAKAFR